MSPSGRRFLSMDRLPKRIIRRFRHHDREESGFSHLHPQDCVTVGPAPHCVVVVDIDIHHAAERWSESNGIRSTIAPAVNVNRDIPIPKRRRSSICRDVRFPTLTRSRNPEIPKDKPYSPPKQNEIVKK
jgi:hypothetical protein